MYRIPVLAVVLGLCAAGCGSSSTTTTPTPTGPPNTVVFTATINSANEVPAPVGPETAGSGTATITFHLTRDSSNAITAANVDFLGVFSGFPSGTALTGAHIHPGAVGVAGGVVISTQIVAGEVTMPNGSGTLARAGIAVTDLTLVNAIIANPAGYYFNIHTLANPAGVARGQLVAKP
jgi:CHRD domain